MVESEMMKKIQAYERHQFGGQDKVIYEAIQKVRNGFKLFAGYCFYFGSAEDRYHLPWQQIELLVYACGG